MTTPGLISVVVSTYNRSDALLAVLDGFKDQTDRDFEVIVADDGSRPEHVHPLLEAAAALRWNFPLRHVWQADIGFTLATVRNQGALQASGDYLIFLDGDCIPQPDFIASHRRLARPEQFVIGSRVLLDPELSAAILAHPETGFRPALWQLMRLRLGGGVNKLLPFVLRWPSGWRKPRLQFRWRGIRGCNLAAWTADFLAIDGFDQAFNGWGHEDADFVLRLHNLGLRRVDGWWATEVLHLWHREAARAGEQTNRQRVLERLQAQPPQIRASIGLHSPPPEGVRVRVLHG